MNESTLTANNGNGYDWHVSDASGGTWWPNTEETVEEIRYSYDPEATILRMCREEPMRGTWAD